MQWGGAQRSLRPTTYGVKRHNPEATLVLFCWPCVSELAQFQIPITKPGKGRCGVNLAQGSGSGVVYMLSALYLPVRMTVQSSPEWLLHPEAGRPWPRLTGFL